MESILSLVGAIFLTYQGFNIACSVLSGLRSFVLPALGFKKDLRKYKPWAVVTGCTDGIGKAYAVELAKLGFKLVLISRSPDKLDTLAEDLESKYGTECKIIVLDFCGGADIYARVEEELEELEIGLLINNVGVSHYPEFYANMKREDCWQMINVNVLSVVMMTHIILPGMVARGKGVIMNISSFAGSQPMPLLSLYSGTKVFVDFFSRSLNTEYASKGITVQCVMPLFVATKMSRIKNASMLVPGPQAFAQESLGAVGVSAQTNGFWSHNLQAWIVSLIPAWIKASLLWRLHLSRRHAVLKRLNKNKKEG